MKKEDVRKLLKAVKINIAVTREKAEKYKNNFSLCDMSENELNEEMKRHYKMKNWLMRELAQAEN